MATSDAYIFYNMNLKNSYAYNEAKYITDQLRGKGYNSGIYENNRAQTVVNCLANCGLFYFQGRGERGIAYCDTTLEDKWVVARKSSLVPSNSAALATSIRCNIAYWNSSYSADFPEGGGEYDDLAYQTYKRGARCVIAFLDKIDTQRAAWLASRALTYYNGGTIMRAVTSAMDEYDKTYRIPDSFEPAKLNVVDALVIIGDGDVPVARTRDSIVSTYDRVDSVPILEENFPIGKTNPFIYLEKRTDKKYDYYVSEDEMQYLSVDKDTGKFVSWYTLANGLMKYSCENLDAEAYLKQICDDLALEVDASKCKIYSTKVQFGERQLVNLVADYLDNLVIHLRVDEKNGELLYISVIRR